jgi:hypothetical protein
MSLARAKCRIFQRAQKIVEDQCYQLVEELGSWHQMATGEFLGSGLVYKHLKNGVNVE